MSVMSADDGLAPVNSRPQLWRIGNCVNWRLSTKLEQFSMFFPIIVRREAREFIGVGNCFYSYFIDLIVLLYWGEYTTK